MSDMEPRRSARFSVRSKQLGRLLMEAGLVKAEHIAKALKIQEQQGGLIGVILRRMGACDDAAVAAALVKQVQVSDISCTDLQAAPELTGLVTVEFCRAEKLCPFERLGNLLCIVMGNPLNRRAIDSIEQTSGLKVKPFKAPWAHIQNLIGRTFTAENMRQGQFGLRRSATIPTFSLKEDPKPPMQTDVSLPLNLDAPLELELEPLPTSIAPPIHATPVQTMTPTVPPAVKKPITERRSMKPKSDDLGIEGLDMIGDEDAAEIVETDERGLRKKENRPKPRVQEEKNRQAKVNVDLDLLDLGKADRIIVTSSAEDEPMEEIVAESAAPVDTDAAALFSDFSPTPKPTPAVPSAPTPEEAPPEILQVVEDDMFYFPDALPPADEKRTPALEKLIAALPEAEVVADCVADWRRRRARLSITARMAPLKTDSGPFQAVKRAKAAPPLWTEPAPLEPMRATALSEAEFQKVLAEGLEPDPQGDWLSEYAASGPLTAQQFDEN